jgi:hypothetical protein
VGDHHRGNAEFVSHLAQEADDAAASLMVEGRRRFVYEQHLWQTHQGTRNIDALTLPAGELMRAFALHRSEPDKVQQLCSAPPCSCKGLSAQVVRQE